MSGYIEQDRPYIAKQLNGPIITGFATACYNFMHSFIDSKTNYFDNLTIETANSDQLSLIGKLMGVPRTYSFSDSTLTNYLTFYTSSFKITQAPFNGFSDEYVKYDGSTDWSAGGIFPENNDVNFIIEIPAEIFRKLLLIIADTKSYTIGSILSIDKISNILLESTEYSIAYDTVYPNKIDMTVSANVSRINTLVLAHIFDILYIGIVDIDITQETE